MQVYCYEAVHTVENQMFLVFVSILATSLMFQALTVSIHVYRIRSLYDEPFPTKSENFNLNLTLEFIFGIYGSHLISVEKFQCRSQCPN
jgi:hypothetical protein